MTIQDALRLLASDGAMARPSLTGPEWHEIVLANGRTVPLSAADFDHLRLSGLVTARDEGSFIMTEAGRRRLEGP